MPWKIVLFDSESKNKIVNTICVNTMKEVGYILNMNSSRVSNVYQQLVKEFGIFKTIQIFKI